MEYNEEKLLTIENKLVANFSNIFLRAYQENKQISFPQRTVEQLEKVNQELLTLAKSDAVHYIGTQYYKNVLTAAEDREAEHLTELMIAYFLIANEDINQSITEYSIACEYTYSQAEPIIENSNFSVRNVKRSCHPPNSPYV